MKTGVIAKVVTGKEGGTMKIGEIIKVKDCSAMPQVVSEQAMELLPKVHPPKAAPGSYIKKAIITVLERVQMAGLALSLSYVNF